MPKNTVKDSNTTKNVFSAKRRGTTPGQREGGAAQDNISAGMEGGRAKGKKGVPVEKKKL